MVEALEAGRLSLAPHAILGIHWVTKTFGECDRVLCVMYMLANAGTPLMWAGCFALLFGNFFIGVFEAWLIRGRRKVFAASATPMIVANYLSMLAGIGLMYLASPLAARAQLDPFDRSLPLLLGMWAATYVLSVLVEWPFVANTAGTRVGLRALGLSAKVQTVSYVFLAVFSYFVGSTSALNLSITSAASVTSVEGWAYYLALDNVNVLRTRLDGSRTEQVAKLDFEIGSQFSRITVEPTSNGDRSRLMYREYGADRELVKNVGNAAQAAGGERDSGNLIQIGNGSFGPGATRKFADSPMVYCGFWQREGLMVNGVRFALETPFLSTPWRCPIVLPDGSIVAQFGEAIVVVDADRRIVAKIGEGRGGDVLLDREYMPSR